jgi:hypothetical protein
VRGSAPQSWALLAAAGLLAAGPVASAGPAEPAPAPPPGPSTADLDGTYVHLGPALGAVRAGGGWDTVVGAGLSVLRVREHALVAIVGGRVTAARWSEGGGRVTAEAVIGTRAALLVGLAAGPLVDLGDLHHPRLGGSASIWCYAGVVPYVKIGVIAGSDRFIEAGLELPLPVWRHRR